MGGIERETEGGKSKKVCGKQTFLKSREIVRVWGRERERERERDRVRETARETKGESMRES